MTAKVLDINYCMFIILIHESQIRDEANENNICYYALKDQRTDTLPLPRPMHNLSPPYTSPKVTYRAIVLSSTYSFAPLECPSSRLGCETLNY